MIAAPKRRDSKTGETDSMDGSKYGAFHFDSGLGYKTKQDDIDNEDAFLQGCKLLRVVARGEREAARALVAASPALIKFRDYDRRTALHIAAAEGYEGIVEDLLTIGARPNRSDRWGGCPLDDALRHRHHAVAARLRAAGAKSAGAVDYGAQLIAAAAAGSVAEVEDLLEDGAIEATARDYDRRTALHLAASEDREAVVALLLARGADVGARDRWGNAAIDGCTAGSRCEKLLLDAGATPLDRDGKAVRSPGLDKAIGALDPGEVRLLDKLGEGSFGAVYRAAWQGTPVAAKVLRPKEKLSPEDRALALKDFRIEVTLLARLRHPNICNLLAYSDSPGKEILVSELLRGSVLDALRLESALPRPRALRWAEELARGMAYLHSRSPPVLHRDLKPGNLLLDAAGSVKIADFGLATIRPQATAASGPGDAAADLTGTTGSYRFMAPEVAANQPYGRPVDVYSFAMILYNCYGGVAPWHEERAEVAAQRACKGERPQLPRAWDESVFVLIRSCWAQDPVSRPSFDAVLEMLDEARKKGTVIEAVGAAPLNGAPQPCCVVS